MEEKSTPLKAKRRRVFDEQTNDEAQYQVDNKKTGDISIDDDDVEGKFVKLCNTGDKVRFIIIIYYLIWLCNSHWFGRFLIF